MSKTLRKWSYDKAEYEPYEIPDDWKLVLYSDDMNELTTCPHCGKKIPYGEGYTSKEIHTNMGFGYYVCEDCYQEEWKRYFAAAEKIEKENECE